MTTSSFKLESGIQMLARLTKRPDIDNFYPNIFRWGPKPGHLIEMYSEDDLSYLLCDIICEAIIPSELGGKEAGVIIFNTDGKLSFDSLLTILKEKVAIRLEDASLIDSVLYATLRNVYILHIYNATQLHTTIQSLDNILINHPNISLVLFHTLTAFYWSEYTFKIMKMDLYLKSLLRTVKNVLKDYKVVILYTRPKYFTSSKENIENLESCYDVSLPEQLNYRVHIVYTEDGTHHAEVRTSNDISKISFRIVGNSIVWL